MGSHGPWNSSWTLTAHELHKTRVLLALPQRRTGSLSDLSHELMRKLGGWDSRWHGRWRVVFDTWSLSKAGRAVGTGAASSSSGVRALIEVLADTSVLICACGEDILPGLFVRKGTHLILVRNSGVGEEACFEDAAVFAHWTHVTVRRLVLPGGDGVGVEAGYETSGHECSTFSSKGSSHYSNPFGLAQEKVVEMQGTGFLGGVADMPRNATPSNGTMPGTNSEKCSLLASLYGEYTMTLCIL